MKKLFVALSVLFSPLCLLAPAHAGQAPLPASAPDIPISGHDRVYAADQTSNTVSIYDPAKLKLLGVISLGQPVPQNLSPLYRGQLLVHGLGFSPDHKTVAVVSVGSNSVTFIDTATNTIKRTAYVGRSPHEAFFTPDGKEVWITIRGEDYVLILDGHTYSEKSRVAVGDGPGMTMFGPDGKYGFVCSSFHPEVSVVETASKKIVARLKQASPFCPNIAVSPDNRQVWITLKDVGKTQVFSAQPPFREIALIDSGPLTNHVNFARNKNGQFAYVSVGGANAVKVFTTDKAPRLVTTIPTPALPHGLWPSADGARIFTGLENGAGVAVIDTLTNQLIAVMPSGQSPQALVYVPNAVQNGDGLTNLQPLGAERGVRHYSLGAPGGSDALTTVAVNSQGLLDLIEAGVSGLTPKAKYQIVLTEQSPGKNPRITPIVDFQTNPAGAAVVVTFAPTKILASAASPDVGSLSLGIRPVREQEPGELVQTQIHN